MKTSPGKTLLIDYQKMTTFNRVKIIVMAIYHKLSLLSINKLLSFLTLFFSTHQQRLLTK
jgi:hypothetical protein